VEARQQQQATKNLITNFMAHLTFNKWIAIKLALVFSTMLPLPLIA
jgi:hypothetical protein